MKSFPRSRVTGETVRAVVARILLEDVKDPRVDFVTVTAVHMSPDLRHANVFVTAHGDAERYATALAGLRSASGRIRSLLGRSVRMRYVPELHFEIDPSVDEALRIAEVLRREEAAGRAPARDAVADSVEADAPDTDPDVHVEGEGHPASGEGDHA
ncbi:MAG TPA: 30S ribosome-binding factor RbfA [Coriobacteriia bacterium]